MLAVLSLGAAASVAGSLGTAITYHGRLVDGTTTANGSYDFTFALYDAANDGTPISPLLATNAVGVSSGLFTVTLDFGGGSFAGDARWLEITVCTNGAGAFTTLRPRQLLTPTPYALYAPAAGVAVSAGVASSVAANAVSSAGLQADSITTDKILNGTIADADIASSGIGGDKIVVGDLQAQRLKVGENHTLGGYLATIAGGYQNTATGPVSVISGGQLNVVGADNGTVSGGYENTVSGNNASIGGGYDNVASGWAARIGGGSWNPATNNYSTVGGGRLNLNYGGAGVISGGAINRLDPSYASTIGGGGQNRMDTNANYDVIGGGWANSVGTNNGFSVISGGALNRLANNVYFATIPGGWSNEVSGSLSFAAGYRARTPHLGSFVWADSTEADFTSTANNQFSIRANGGVRFETAGQGLLLDGQPVLSGLVQAANLDPLLGFWNRSGSDLSYGAGHVGIGTLSPSATLDVASTVGRQIPIGTWADLSGNAAGRGLLGGNMYTDFNPPAFKYAVTHGDIGAMGFAVNYPAWNQASVISSGTSSSTAGVEFTPQVVATFASGGNVGIGTSDPWAPLHVKDSRADAFPTVAVDGAGPRGTWLKLNNTSAGGRDWNLISTGSANGEGAGKFLVYDDTADRVALQVDSAGTVKATALEIGGLPVAASGGALTVNGQPVLSGTVQAANMAPGAAVRSLNGMLDHVTLAAGANVTMAAEGNTLRISATPGTVVTNAGWGLSGNAGTTATNSLGTTDGQPLELRVNGQRALRLEAGDIPNVIGGSDRNSVGPGVQGATIAGANTILIAWPGPEAGWRLESTPDLAAQPVAWTERPPPYSATAAHLEVVERVAVGNRFYRLHRH
jgi:hypothetical protein